jgi:hypothetical protein
MYDDFKCYEFNENGQLFKKLFTIGTHNGVIT